MALSLLLALVPACTTTTITTVPSDSDQEGGPVEEPDAVGEGEEVTGIPVGQMPPPGACRIWDPKLPTGRQDPPGDCDELRDRVPLGAWLLFRPNDEPRVYRIA